jgi:TAT-translocated FGD2 family F420-dependent dehydrogenase
VTLAALGARTQRVPFGTGVTCPTYRYRPAIVAEAFATLGLLYPGRVFLGVGAGEALNEVPAGGGWGNYAERSSRMIEAVDNIRRLWAGEIVNHRGDYYTVENAKLYDVPAQPIPIYIAASGPKSMRLAGHYGDGLITDGERALKPELRAAFEAGARAAGKDPATLPILAEQWVVVGDKAEAERGARLWQFVPKAWETYVKDPDPRDIERRAAQEVPLEQVYSKWPVSTDPQVHIEALHKLIDDGVTQIYIHSPQPDQARVIRFYAEQVLPKLRR